jgi:hypothetical protein
MSCRREGKGKKKEERDTGRKNQHGEAENRRRTERDSHLQSSSLS